MVAPGGSRVPWSTAYDQAQAFTGAPEPIPFEEHVFDLAFHPSRTLVAAGLITGQLFMVEYGVGAGGNTLLAALQPHTDSVRALYTVSADRSVHCLDVTTGQSGGAMLNAHDTAINALQVLPGGNTVVTGDDDGLVKVWDLRQRAAVMDFGDHTDYISDLAVVPHKKIILATSGDGTLSVMDWRKGTRKSSYPLDDEPLSVVVMKNTTKAVCGTQEGTLAFYDWGIWSDVSDRMPGHPQSVDAMVKITEDVLVTGSSDGLLRAVHIHPNKLLAIVGEHEGFPVERIRISGDGSLLGSCSHDNTIKFWSTESIPTSIPEGDAPLPNFPLQAMMAAADAADMAKHDDDDFEDFNDDDDNDDGNDDDDDENRDNGASAAFDYRAARRSGGSFLADL